MGLIISGLVFIALSGLAVAILGVDCDMREYDDMSDRGYKPFK